VTVHGGDRRDVGGTFIEPALGAPPAALVPTAIPIRFLPRETKATLLL
jgi:hypothetical protein